MDNLQLKKNLKLLKVFLAVSMVSMGLSFLLSNNVQITSRNDESSLTTDINNSNFSTQIYPSTALFNIETEGLPVINVSDYEGQNQTEKIQAALNDVPESGAIVFIPSGTWEAAGLTAKSNTILTGTNETVIERPLNTTVPFIKFSNVSNFAVLNLTFDGKNVTNALGIMILDSKNFLIKRNTFLGIDKNAIKVAITLNGVSRNFTFSDNFFLNCNDVPIHVFGIPSKRNIENFIIENNRILNGTRNGKIGIAFADNGTLRNNIIEKTQHGIATRCVSNININENFIKNVSDYGIYLGTQIGDPGTSEVKIIDNSILESKIGIARYYGNYPVTDVYIANNLFLNNIRYDILADFPGHFVNNTITEKSKLKIIDLASTFEKTKTSTGNLVIPGDINEDFKINIIDVALIAISFGSSEGSPGWNTLADVISDGKIDIKDISFVARNFGYEENL